MTRTRRRPCPQGNAKKLRAEKLRADCRSPTIVYNVYTLARNITYINNSELISENLHFSYKNTFFFGNYFPKKLHIKDSFVIRRITRINCLGIISWEISFQLHKIRFSELISQ